MPAYYYCRFKNTKMFSVVNLSNGSEQFGLAKWRNGRRRARLCYMRNENGLREQERKGCLTLVELDSSRRSCTRSTYMGNMKRYVDLCFLNEQRTRDFICFMNAFT